MNKNYPKYCQFCGSSNLDRYKNESAFKCQQCHKIIYLNSKPSVCAVIVDNNNNVLLVSDSNSNFVSWDLPGGFLLYGESPEEGLKRELKEELNADIEIEQLLTALIDIYGKPPEFSLNLFYKANLISNEIVAGGEIKRFQWFNIQNLPHCKYKSTFKVLSNICNHDKIIEIG